MTGRKVGAAAVVINARGDVLLVRHNYGPLNWELPGGAAEPGESIAATAERETREETGLVVVAERVTGIYFDPRADVHHFAFACRAADPAALPRPGADEITECGFHPPADLPRPISDFTVRRIREALAGAAVTVPAVIGPRRWRR